MVRLKVSKHRKVFWTTVTGALRGASRPAAYLLRQCAPSVRTAIQPSLHAVYAWLSRKQSSQGSKLWSLDDFHVETPRTEAPGARPRLLVDVSTTYYMSRVSGIQRTVRSLTSALKRKGIQYGFDIIPVCLQRRHDGKLVLIGVPGYPDSTESEFAIALRPGDCFFMLDSSWDLYPKWADALFPKLRALGGKVFTCVYDILPITNPEYFTTTTLEMFVPWFEAMMRESDLVLAISEATRSDLASRIVKRRPQMEVFHLGADSLPVHPIAREVTNSPRFLMVGTIEPRKGHSTVLRAFEDLWTSRPDVRLIFVGREGWKVSGLMERISRLQKTNSSFVYHNDASDDLLARCYDEADAVISASLAEGFGLPLVETMQRGKPLIASDIQAFREVAGDFPIYFRAGDPSSLIDAVRTFLASERLCAGPTPQWITWDQSADQLMRKIERFCGLAAGLQ